MRSLAKTQPPNRLLQELDLGLDIHKISEKGNAIRLCFSFFQNVKCFLCSGNVEKQVVDGGGECGEFPIVFDVSYYFVVFLFCLDLQTYWSFEVVGRNRFCNGFCSFSVFVLKSYCGFQASHPLAADRLTRQRF